MRIDPPPPPLVLPLAVRLEFVHALVDLVVRRTGSRLLHVKGRAAARHLGLAGRASGDVDVWVAPEDRASMVAGLEAIGWRRHSASLETIDHATVLTHSVWGCAIDLHHRFPGVGVEPGVAFESLWERREEARLAGRPVPVPARAAHALVLLLHAARGRGEAGAQHDIQQVTSTLDRASVAELQAWAQILQCQPALAAVVPGWTPAGDRLEHLHWRVRAGASGASGAHVWLTRIIASRGLRPKSALLRMAVLPDRASMSRRAGRELTPVALLRARFLRLGTGAVRTPGALATVVRGLATAPPPPPARPLPAARTCPAPAQPHSGVGPPATRAWCEADGLTWVADLPGARAFALAPAAAAVWRSAMRAGGEGDASEEDPVRTDDPVDHSTLDVLRELGVL